MSFKAFVWAWDQEVTNGDHHHVLLCLANIAPNRKVRASIPYIAKQVHRSSRKVRAALVALELAGILSRTPRIGKVDLITLMIPPEFKVYMDDDDDDDDREAGDRGRPSRTPPKGLTNPCTRGSDETIEPLEPPEPRLSTDVDLPAKADRSEAARAFDRYNELAERHGWTAAKVLNESRRRSINARIREANGVAPFISYLDDIENSDFLMGRVSGQRGAFAISLDFLIQPSSFAKLMEGFYHRERSNGATAIAGGGGAAVHAERNAAMFAGARAALDQRQRERGGFGGS